MSPLHVEWKDTGAGTHILGDSLVLIHRKIGEGNRWFVSCRRMGIDSTRLVSIDLGEAKDEAGRYLGKVLADLNLRFGFLLAP